MTDEWKISLLEARDAHIVGVKSSRMDVSMEMECGCKCQIESAGRNALNSATG